MYFPLMGSTSKSKSITSFFFFFLGRKYICGDLLFDSSGTFQSPFYPGNYPDNAECLWQIQVVNNFRIMLTFGRVE